MAQTSWPWGGLVTGDATLAPYSADEWSDIWRKLYQRDRTLEGVMPDYLNELLVTNPSGVTIRTASGGALVDGTSYDNTANVDNVGVAPGGGSNFYRVVLRKGWAAQTVRIALLGPNVAAPDAVTQTDGVTWEISLATVEITSGSVVTVTDDRTYLHFNTEIISAMIAANAITNAKMADDAVDTAEIVDLAVTSGKMADGACLAEILDDDGAGSGLDADLLDGQEGAFYNGPLVDYSAISTVTGWASFTTKLIKYQKDGNRVFVEFIITGTSNATNAQFTLPYSNNSGVNVRFYVRGRDNGIWQPASLGLMPTGGALVQFLPDSGSGALWTAANEKSIEGQFSFYTS